MSNDYRIEGDVVYIALKPGIETIVDLADLEKIAQYAWYAVPNMMSGYYVSSRTENKTVYLHRAIMDAPKGRVVNHINHDTLDNRRSNLRIVTHQQNDSHRNGHYNTSKLGVRGVSIHRSNGPAKTVYYVFRCHIKQCRATKYFPFTDEGFAQATVYAEAHYAQMRELLPQ